MEIWHLTADAPRRPRRVCPHAPVEMVIGTWPVEPGQHVWVAWESVGTDGTRREGCATASWAYNAGPNSYWTASVGPFTTADEVTYVVRATTAQASAQTSRFAFRVQPALYLALLWHHHQPLYRDPSAIEAAGSYLLPWVRLHALRDYYSMAAIAAEHQVPVTINLTPVLLRQLDDYVSAGATDRALELTASSAERLEPTAIAEMLTTFFEADWDHQIRPHDRYRELYEQRAAGRAFGVQDVRDLQMWFNLAWFGIEFRTGDVRLPTGEIASVKRFVDRGRGFTHEDIAAMVGEQYKILRAIVPLHRTLQEAGAIEVSTTPAFHPILPLLMDTDQAYLDGSAATRPPRFAQLDDAQAQVQMAIADYRMRFGLLPGGMWPAEGAVSSDAVSLLSAHGIRWTATDQGVLARSGRWGYDVTDPRVLCQPYRFDSDGRQMAIFFRDKEISDAIGFRYQHVADSEAAGADLMRTLERRLEALDADDADHLLTVILDGENPWGAYASDGRPFLHALYTRIAGDSRIQAVTFSQFLNGDGRRGVGAHPVVTLTRVHALATGSWIDEPGSAPGVDLGTWIGEPEENYAWELLAGARRRVARAVDDGRRADAALQSLYAAEGSDWFWWFGTDQPAPDTTFARLFRLHLRHAYQAIGELPPVDIGGHGPRHSSETTTSIPAAARPHSVAALGAGGSHPTAREHAQAPDSPQACSTSLRRVSISNGL